MFLNSTFRDTYLTTISRSFVMRSDKSGWKHMAEKSAFSTLLLRRSLSGQSRSAFASVVLYVSSVLCGLGLCFKSRHSCLMLAQCLCFINSKYLVVVFVLLDRSWAWSDRADIMCRGSLWRADRHRKLCCTERCRQNGTWTQHMWTGRQECAVCSASCLQSCTSVDSAVAPYVAPTTC